MHTVSATFRTNLDGQTGVGLVPASSLPNSSRPLRDYHDHYVFDLAGNRIKKTTDVGIDGTADAEVDLIYDANDRLLTEAHDDNADGTPDRTTLYGYGPNNSATQQTSKEFHSGQLSDLGPRLSALSLEYGLQGRLVSATTTTYDEITGAATRTEQTTYVYDGLGIRVSALTKSTPTQVVPLSPMH